MTSTMWNQAARVWWSTLAIVVGLALPLELFAWLSAPALDVSAATIVVRFFSYFTIQSNALLLVATLPLARDPTHDGPWWRVVRLASLLGVSVTGIVFAAVLAPLYHPVGLPWWTSLGLHDIAPAMAIMGWAFFGPWGRITSTTIARVMLWPAAWIGWTLVHGATSGWYPYPFLSVPELGYAIALRNIGFVFAFALCLLALYRGVDGVLARRLRTA